MCGIVGFINSSYNAQDYKAERGLFEQMLYADALRGFDSTGIFWKKAKEECRVFKKAMAATDFLDLNTTNKILTNIDQYDFIVGHNRWATQGGVNHKNAHPFQSGPITLVHNGTLTSWKHLEGANDCLVDSEAICNLIAKIGIEEAAKKLDGAFALVWHDSRNNTINLFRNDQRPLHFTYVKASNGNAGKSDIIISSEYQMSNWIAERNGYKVEHAYIVPVGKLIVFDRMNLENYESKTLELIKHSNVKSFPAYGNKKDDKKSDINQDNPVLKEAGLKFGDTVELAFTEWEYYQKGGAFGYLCEYVVFKDKVYEVRYNGFSAKEGEKYLDVVVTCNVKSAWVSKDHDHPIITVGDLVVVPEKNSNAKPHKGNVKYTIYNKKEVSAEEWTKRTKCGCAWCGQVPDDKDAPDLVWDDYNTFTCLDCQDELMKDRMKA